MEKQNRTHVQVLLPEIMAMMAEEKTRRAEGQAVKRLLERERRKGRKLETEILPRPKGAAGRGCRSQGPLEISTGKDDLRIILINSADGVKGSDLQFTAGNTYQG